VATNEIETASESSEPSESGENMPVSSSKDQPKPQPKSFFGRLASKSKSFLGNLASTSKGFLNKLATISKSLFGELIDNPRLQIH
jgi:hypothetical protein